MRVVIGVLFIAIMGCVFTLMTAVIFVTQHPFASVALASLATGALVATVRRSKTRRAQPGLGYPAAMAGPQPRPVSRWAASEMSSAVSPRRCVPTLPPGRCLP
ncbi:hypothetical protein MSIMFB_04505 [Mycobacterium simulans]|uniref:Lipoprotein n=1 Tax=Mycobacterium simulans TaxID=627089 RepID=A0A7Z7INS7_9MYCO|nr:hypothetical protein [Mycobacterium simulans]SOJ57027.1 hypothetical protein MSIMFB_04505 [Mycobacterium simulans]